MKRAKSAVSPPLPGGRCRSCGWRRCCRLRQRPPPLSGPSPPARTSTARSRDGTACGLATRFVAVHAGGPTPGGGRARKPRRRRRRMTPWPLSPVVGEMWDGRCVVIGETATRWEGIWCGLGLLIVCRVYCWHFNNIYMLCMYGNISSIKTIKMLILNFIYWVHCMAAFSRTTFK